MTTFTHTLSASYIAASSADVTIQQPFYLILALAPAALLDLDHVFYLIKDRQHYRENGYRGELHLARSFLHELTGLVPMGIITILVYTFDAKAAHILFVSYLVHVVEDMLIGISIPFTPFDKTQLKLFDFSIKQKTLIDVLLISVFSILWILYLADQV